MGDTDVNLITGRHGREGAPNGGFVVVLHKAMADLYEQSPETTGWLKYRAVLIAARSGDDAALDAAAAEAWGGWWADHVLSRGLRWLARIQLSNFIPPAFPIP